MLKLQSEALKAAVYAWTDGRLVGLLVASVRFSGLFVGGGFSIGLP